MEPYLQPVTSFVVFDTTSSAVDMLCEVKWWNWTDTHKARLVRRVRTSDTVGMALAKDGLWVRTVPITCADKSPFVFFVELKVQTVL